jgi:hypothetical protein
LSKRWKHLWKSIPALTLYFSSFSTLEKFDLFMSKILTLRDTSTPVHTLDLLRWGYIEPHHLKNILDYVSSHKTHLQDLRISINGDSALIMSCVSSCQALTSLEISFDERSRYNDGLREALFPTSLNFPSLTSLDLTMFAFCGGENNCVEPFLAFKRLNSLC